MKEMPMPTYEYRCDKCGHTFERFHGMTADPVVMCPKCQGPVTRLIGGGSAILFKGPRFHAADYGPTKGSACSRGKPCCGRDTPCEHRPCET
jgi:putative FmdB family regulatory protein